MTLVYCYPRNISIFWRKLFSFLCHLKQILDSLIWFAATINLLPTNSHFFSTFHSKPIPSSLYMCHTSNKSHSFGIIFLLVKFNCTSMDLISSALARSMHAVEFPLISVFSPRSNTVGYEFKIYCFPYFLNQISLTGTFTAFYMFLRRYFLLK